MTPFVQALVRSANAPPSSSLVVKIEIFSDSEPKTRTFSAPALAAKARISLRLIFSRSDRRIAACQVGGTAGTIFNVMFRPTQR